jgi:glucokinase
MSAFLGLDIGASSIKYGWGNQDRLLHFASMPITIKALVHLKQVAANILEATDRAIGLSNISAIGIGTPGTIDRGTGHITGINPNLPFWVNHCPAELIPPELSIPVFYDNDANLMALAEAKQCQSKHALGITVGSGIGGGVILNGSVYHGAHGFAGEIGHVCVVEEGILCNCGRSGCLEAYASVDGIRKRISDSDINLANLELTALLKLHDSRVLPLINNGSTLLVTAIVNIVTMLDLDSIVIGGGGMEANLYDIAKLKKDIDMRLPLANRGKVRILKAFYGNRAGVIGAIQLAEQGISNTWE